MGSQTWTIAGPIGGSGSLLFNPSGFANGGSSTTTLTLSGTNAYGGSTTINLGTLIASGGSAIPDTSQVKLPTSGSSTAIFQVNTSETIGSLSGGLSTSGSVTLNGSGVTLTAGGDNSSTSYGGNVTGAGTFQKAGNGTMTISQDWANTGGVVINAGTIKFGTGAAGFAATVPVSINNGGKLDMNSIGDTFGSLSSTAGQTTGVLSMGSGNTLHLGQTASTGRTYSGEITGSGTLDKAGGTWTQTLSGDNSGFTGPITITLGNIAVGSVNALGTTAGGTSVSSGELLFDGAANSYTIAEPISIAGVGVGSDGGAITVQNSSVTNLTGPITLTADATVTTSSSATSTYSNANAFTGTDFNLTLQGGSGRWWRGTLGRLISVPAACPSCRAAHGSFLELTRIPA